MKKIQIISSFFIVAVLCIGCGTNQTDTKPVPSVSNVQLVPTNLDTISTNNGLKIKIDSLQVVPSSEVEDLHKLKLFGFQNEGYMMKVEIENTSNQRVEFSQFSIVKNDNYLSRTLSYNQDVFTTLDTPEQRKIAQKYNLLYAKANNHQLFLEPNQKIDGYVTFDVSVMMIMSWKNIQMVYHDIDKSSHSIDMQNKSSKK